MKGENTVMAAVNGDEVTVRVALLEGDEAVLQVGELPTAEHHGLRFATGDEGETARVPVPVLTEATGLGRADLPGKVLAAVRDGDGLAGFRLA